MIIIIIIIVIIVWIYNLDATELYSTDPAGYGAVCEFINLIYS